MKTDVDRFLLNGVPCLGRVWFFVACICAAAAPVPAARADESQQAWHLSAEIQGGYIDNVRWAEDGPQKDGAYYTTVSGRALWAPQWSRFLPTRLATGVRARFYEDFSARDWVEIQPEAFYDFDRSTVRLRYRYTPERLRLDEDPLLGDVFAVRHYGSVMAERKLGRGKKWRLRMEAESEWDSSKTGAKERDSFTPFASLEARYRFHSLFVPRVSAGYGQREAKDANYDRDELVLSAGFDSSLPVGVHLRFRYKRLERDYTVSTARGPAGSNSNFRRNDDIDQFMTTLEVPVAIVDGLSFVLSHTYRDSQSSKDSRNFDLHDMQLGLRYEY